MSALGGNRTVKRWVCCTCHEAGISINFGDCPGCKHSRCIDCHMRSHVATDTEIEEDKKIASGSAQAQRLRLRLFGGGGGGGEGSQPHGMSRPLIGTRASPSRENFSEPVTPLSHMMNVALPSGIVPSPHQPSMYLCEIASGTRGHHIFILREAQDSELISLWHKKLAGLSNHCQSFCESIVSMHLFRMGIDEQSSKPTVLVNTAQSLDDTRKRMFQYTISDTLSSARPLVLIDFRESRLRRSIDERSLDLPPICEPRNRDFSAIPETGASIGISGSVVDTATLGCYLLVNGKPMALTVDHLIPAWLRYPNTTITHNSEQDCQDILGAIAKKLINDYIELSAHLCDACADLRSPTLTCHEVLSRLTTLQNSLWPISCPLYQQINSKILAEKENRCHPFQLGTKYSQSGRRFRTLQSRLSSGSQEVRREMDWALFAVLEDDKFDLSELARQNRYCRPSSEFGDRFLHPAQIRPGASVRSLGRTSGHQVGQVSNTASIIFHGPYQTEEWCVIKRPETGTDAWVEGGIGVDGDSGALIVDGITGGVYGMLWGRSGDGPTTVTLFTPILEIFNDIREIGGPDLRSDDSLPSPISMMPGQVMPKPSGPSPGSMPPSEVATVPITVRMDEDNSDNLLEQPIPTPGLRRLSSIETGSPRPFERYRGHGTRRHSIPRSMEHHADEEKVNPGQFPGSYTYFRQAIAPEKE